MPIEGKETFFKYISKNIKYPKAARKTGIEGRVFVEFIVDTDGSLKDIKIVKGIDPKCDKSALKVLKNASNWHPARYGGVIVKRKIILPITFKLG